MVNFLSSWVKNLSLVLIVISILEMIIPNNKTKKYIKMIMGLYILFSIISPFIQNSDKFNIDNIDFDSYLKESRETSTSEVNQSSMDKRLKEIYTEELEKDISKKVTDKGYIVERCKVDAYVTNQDSGINKITLKIQGKINKDGDKDDEQGNNLESKLVNEIQKIQKVDIKVSQNEEYKEDDKSNITNTDIKIIEKFLKEEYGVSEECLKIS